MLFKYVLFIYFKLDIENILKDKFHFWDYRKFGKKTIEETTKIYYIVNFIQNSSIAVSFAAILLYFLKPAFNNDDVYIIDAWIFTDSVVIEVTVLACQYYFLIVIAIVVPGYDSIYLSLCTHVVLQLRLLKYKLKQLSKFSYESAKREIRMYIQYHQLLIS